MFFSVLPPRECHRADQPLHLCPLTARPSHPSVSHGQTLGSLQISRMLSETVSQELRLGGWSSSSLTARMQRKMHFSPIRSNEKVDMWLNASLEPLLELGGKRQTLAIVQVCAIFCICHL